MFEFHLPSMKCGGCADSVTGAIQQADRDAVIEVNLEYRTVRVKPSIGEDEIAAVLAAAGHPARGFA